MGLLFFISLIIGQGIPEKELTLKKPYQRPTGKIVRPFHTEDFNSEYVKDTRFNRRMLDR